MCRVLLGGGWERPVPLRACPAAADQRRHVPQSKTSTATRLQIASSSTSIFLSIRYSVPIKGHRIRAPRQPLSSTSRVPCFVVFFCTRRQRQKLSVPCKPASGKRDLAMGPAGSVPGSALHCLLLVLLVLRMTDAGERGAGGEHHARARPLHVRL